MPTPSRLIAFAFLSALGAASLHAQADQTVQLDKLVVTGIPIEDSVNPLTRDLSTVMGDSRGILDTPRAVSSDIASATAGWSGLTMATA